MAHPRPPQPDNVPMQGDGDRFKGANPWSGPYLVVGVLVVLLAVVAFFVIGTLTGTGS